MSDLVDKEFEEMSSEIDRMVREQTIKEEYEIRMELERKRLKRKYSLWGRFCSYISNLFEKKSKVVFELEEGYTNGAKIYCRGNYSIDSTTLTNVKTMERLTDGSYAFKYVKGGEKRLYNIISWKVMEIS